MGNIETKAAVHNGEKAFRFLSFETFWGNISFWDCRFKKRPLWKILNMHISGVGVSMTIIFGQLESKFMPNKSLDSITVGGGAGSCEYLALLYTCRDVFFLSIWLPFLKGHTFIMSQLHCLIDCSVRNEMIRDIVKKEVNWTFFVKENRCQTHYWKTSYSLQTDFPGSTYGSWLHTVFRISDALTFSCTSKQCGLHNPAHLLACLQPVWLSKQSCFLPHLTLL